MAVHFQVMGNPSNGIVPFSAALLTLAMALGEDMYLQSGLSFP